MLHALLTSPSVAAAAATANVSPSTVWRYLGDDRFAEAYRAARRDLVGHLRMRFEADAGHAEQVLHDIAGDADSPASARVSACRVIIEGVLKTFEQTEIEARIEEIEKLLNSLEKERDDARRTGKSATTSYRFGR